MADCVAPMLFRLIFLLAIAGVLTVFTVQNLTPLMPLVFLSMQFPALPLSWWVLGAIAAGALTTLAIRLLFELSNFAAGQAVRSRVRSTFSRSGGENRWATSTTDSVHAAPRTSSRNDRSPDDDTAWKDWRGYETPEPQTSTSHREHQSTVKESVDDWERPSSDDWETPTSHSTSAAPIGASDRQTPQDSNRAAKTPSAKQTSPSGSSYSYGYRDPEGSGVGKPEKVVDADYRVIVPPYRPLDEPVSTPSPSASVEENADDWFEDSSDEFGDEKGDR